MVSDLIIPVSEDVDELCQILSGFDTIIRMKVAKKLDEVIRAVGRNEIRR